MITIRRKRRQRKKLCFSMAHRKRGRRNQLILSKSCNLTPLCKQTRKFNLISELTSIMAYLKRVIYVLGAALGKAEIRQVYFIEKLALKEI